MNEPIRSWIPTPGWWVPVWVTFDLAGGSADALEEAVEGLVRAGLRTPADLARELCVHLALVEGAVATLLSNNTLAASEGGLVARPEAPAEEGARARAGFVAWDPSTQRPLLQLWMDSSVPEDPVAPRGWRLAPWEEPEGYPRSPRTDDVAERLRILPSAGDLRVYEPRGLGVHEVDGGQVRRLRRRSGAPVRHPIWVAVEQRVQGPVVWRPTVVPLPEVGTELDPRGRDGLLGTIGEAARAEVEAAETECVSAVAPGVLKEAGFASSEELRQSARAEAARELGDLGGWDGLSRAVEDAFVTQRLAPVARLDWRRLVQAWGHVLEVLTRAITVRLRGTLARVQPRPLSFDDERRLRPLLGRSTRRVMDVARDPSDMRRLQSAVVDEIDSLGTRLLALGVCVALDPGVRRAFEEVCGGAPAVFDALDTAIHERNKATHVREDDDAIAVAGHRERVLLVCRRLARLDLLGL